ncbi:Protein of unknown function DUF484 [hydrothermal vent metagenome]|uniref:DUF484 domain-containing protein n=1 Tax=hydrothermal vent metagenome TaxID=652676 RepID=A0A3B0VZX3_9ZZZZ
MTKKSTLHPEEVVNYLDQNRKFFHACPNLLDELSIPHPKTGKAVSLLERQVFQLREQRDALKVEVDTLLNIAGENGQLFLKVQAFTKALMAVQTEQAALDCIYEQMAALFSVEHIAMVSWDVPKQCLQGLSQLGVSQTWSETLKTSLETNKPVCGFVENEWQKGLFHTQESMKSVCLLPLGEQSVWGVLALGSQTERFNPDLGTYFLTMMSELISAKLNHLFTD